MTKMFKNGYGISVIDTGYGRERGLYELAVLKNNDIHYNNPVACGDVRGYLNSKDVKILSSLVKMFDENTEKNYLCNI